jgi:hypothetical protein
MIGIGIPISQSSIPLPKPMMNVLRLSASTPAKRQTCVGAKRSAGRHRNDGTFRGAEPDGHLTRDRRAHDHLGAAKGETRRQLDAGHKGRQRR